MINKDTNTLQVNVYIFSTNSLQQLKKFPFRNFERDFFHLYFFNAFFWRKWTFLGAPGRQDEHPDASFVKMRRFFLSFWHFSPREVRGQYFCLKPPFKEFRTRVEKHWRVHWQDSRSLPLSLACTFYLLDEFLQGTHQSIILTGTGVARWSWESKVF